MIVTIILSGLKVREANKASSNFVMLNRDGSPLSTITNIIVVVVEVGPVVDEEVVLAE